MERTSSFGYWLRRRRKALDLTQEELAQRVGCASGTIKKLEADERRPSKQLAARLADMLQIPADERDSFLKAARADLAIDQLAIVQAPLETDATPPPTAQLPAGTVTFLLTDVAEAAHPPTFAPEAMRVALATRAALLHTTFTAHQGVVFKTVEGAAYAAFPSAVDALNAAHAGQRALVGETMQGIGALHMRMALYTGTAEIRTGDYTGPTLQRAERLLETGHGGQILLSATSWELARDHLPPDVSARDLGVHWLKRLSRPEQIYQLVAPNLPADFPPLTTLNRPTTNLPMQTTTFIGREREVAALCDLIRRNSGRLVTLTGPGGTGKTRLALQVAEALLDDYPDGVWFVNLAPLSDPDLLASAIAQTFSLRQRGDQSMQEAVTYYLRTKRLLLLLDNFEQIVDAAPLIAALLAAAPGLTALVTSRQILRLSGEREFCVAPLGLPDQTQSLDLERLPSYDAITLFITRAQVVKPGFVVTNENVSAVAEICIRLEGLPLAIELAVARLKLFSPQALLARLTNRLTFLTGGARDLPQRQQTIRNTIDWSYGLLDADEQRLFARLGVFVGGCTIEAAESIGAAHSDLPMEVVDGIAALVDKSLLRQVEGTDGEHRFVMLETIREYALERLAAGGEEQTVREQHAAYYLALAAQAEPALRSAEQPRWLDRLEAEHDNMRAALHWSQSSDRRKIQLRLVRCLWQFWYLRGYWSEGRQWIDDILANIDADEQSEEIAWAFTGKGQLAWYQGDMDTAIEYTDAALDLWRALDNKRGLAYALNSFSDICWPQGKNAEGRASLEESLQLYQTLDDRWGIAFDLSCLGTLFQAQGEFSEAEQMLEQALTISRTEGYDWLTAHALLGLGDLASQQGEYMVARDFYEASLAIYHILGEKGMLTWGLLGLSLTTWQNGDPMAAHAIATQALALARDLNELWVMTQILHVMADIAQSQSQYLQAAENLTEGLAVCPPTGYEVIRLNITMRLGIVMLDQGEYAQALSLFRESLSLAQQFDHPYGIAFCGVGFAALAIKQEQPIQGTRLLGATDRLQKMPTVHLNPIDGLLQRQIMTEAQAQLDEATFATAWAAGQGLTLEQIITEALSISAR